MIRNRPLPLLCGIVFLLALSGCGIGGNSNVRNTPIPLINSPEIDEAFSEQTAEAPTLPPASETPPETPANTDPLPVNLNGAASPSPSETPRPTATPAPAATKRPSSGSSSSGSSSSGSSSSKATAKPSSTKAPSSNDNYIDLPLDDTDFDNDNSLDIPEEDDYVNDENETNTSSDSEYVDLFDSDEPVIQDLE